MINVFADLHHNDLFYSLQLLFEKRLGYALYRPIGMEWWERKYWAVYPHVDTAKQYLSTEQAIDIPKDVHGEELPPRSRLNANYEFRDGIYYVMDPTKDVVVRGITFETFRDMKFDILLSSIPQHIPIWNELIAKYQPQAKHIFQVGNAWGQLRGVKNILASTAPFPTSSGINTCFYHQEFDLNVYRYEPPDPSVKKIRSFIHYMKRPDLLQLFKQLLPEFTFTTHGAGMDQDICRTEDIAQAYRDSSFVWHVKPEGDGFGYCYSGDTEILTENGWKLFKDLDKSEAVATFNPNNGALEYQKPTDYIEQDYDGPMCHFKGQTIDMLVSPDHRVYVERYDKNARSKGWRIEKAKDIDYMKAYHPSRAVGFKLAADQWKGGDFGISKEWAWLLGWYMAEGSVAKNKKISKRTGKLLYSGHRIGIPNTNLKYLNEIKFLAHYLGFENVKIRKCKKETPTQGSFQRRDGSLCPRKQMYSLWIYSKDLYDKLVVFGKCDEKYIPREVLFSSKEILWNFLEPFFLGDGCVEGCKGFQSTMISTNVTSKKLIDQLQEIAVKLGLRSHLIKKGPSPVGKRDIWKLRITLSLCDNYKHLVSKKKLYNKYREVRYCGKIYCISVPNSLVFVRRNGIPVVSGNSIHCSPACGRPLIIVKQYYKDRLAEELLTDLKTCIDIGCRPVEESVQLIRHFSQPEEHLAMCERAYRRFKEVVDFDQEEQVIRQFLSRLL